MKAIDQLFNVFTEKQVAAIKDCIIHGLWGDTCCVFQGDNEDTDTFGYCTGNIYKGGNFSNQQISGICSGIAKVVREQNLNWIYYDADAWGDNSGGMIYFHFDRMGISRNELKEWANQR